MYKHVTSKLNSAVLPNAKYSTEFYFLGSCVCTQSMVCTPPMQKKKKEKKREGGDIRKQQISEAVTSSPSASLPHPEDRQRKECWHMPQLLPCAVRWPWLHRQASAATPLWPKKFRHFWRQNPVINMQLKNRGQWYLISTIEKFVHCLKFNAAGDGIVNITFKHINISSNYLFWVRILYRSYWFWQVYEQLFSYSFEQVTLPWFLCNRGCNIFTQWLFL